MKRYRMEVWGAPATPCVSEEEDDIGEWVKYEDVLSLVIALNKCRELVKYTGSYENITEVVNEVLDDN